MRAYVANGKELVSNIEDHNCPAFNFKKESLSVWQFTGGRNFYKFNFCFVGCCVIEHNCLTIDRGQLTMKKPREDRQSFIVRLFHQIITCFAETIDSCFQHLERKKSAFQSNRSQINAEHIKDMFLVELF